MTAGLEADQAARQRIRQSLGESLIVEAAAGTGKTTELVARLVEVLASGATRVQNIVAVTFTRKAAGELKLRLRQGLDNARNHETQPDRRTHLEDSLARLEEARIGTIHGFCIDLLRARPVEAGIDPAFEELGDEQAERLFSATFRRWISERLAAMPQGLKRAFCRFKLRSGRSGTPLSKIRKAGWTFVEWRDYTRPWRREPFDRQQYIDGILPLLSELAELRRRGTDRGDYLWQGLEIVDEMDRWLVRIQQERECDPDELEGRLMQMHQTLRRRNWVGRRKMFAPGLPREEVLAVRERLMDRLAAFGQLADSDLAAMLQLEMSSLVARYEAVKRAAGKLDFRDLLLLTRDLLRDNAEVRVYFGQRYSHIFVDEFQDTDPLQAEILLLLSADDPLESDWRKIRPRAGKLFLVGDPKQSIYRFRRADVRFYQQVCDQLERVGVARVHLSRSYRALPDLQEAINSAFEPLMKDDRRVGQPEYVPLLPDRDPHPGQPALVALPVPQPYGWRSVTKTAVRQSLPEGVAAYISWLIKDSGWTVEDPEDRRTRVPIAPQHICILFKRFTTGGSDLTRDYTSQLEARQIPHVLVGYRSFHQREEVETLRAALTAIEWPDDALNVYATLKGSLFSFQDDLLLRYRETVGRLHPFRRARDEDDSDLAEVSEVLSLLADLHRRRNRRPVVETINELLELTRARAGFGLRAAGDQVLANVQRVCDRARAYEMGGGISFRGFVEELIEAANRGPGALEAPVLGDGAREVSMMTVHKAKGLEFPVVILADIDAPSRFRTATSYVEPDRGLAAIEVIDCMPWELHENQELEGAREEAEAVRLAYVAATRARDLLVVPVVGSQQLEGWIAPLHRVLYPDRENWRESEPAPGCPPFGTSSVLPPKRGDAVVHGATVRPGQHRPEVGQHSVVWWDPQQLTLNVTRRYGLRQSQILVDDGCAKGVQEGHDNYEAWERQRREAIQQGGRPQHVVSSATEAAAEDRSAGPFELTFETCRPPEEEDLPGGRRFGTLVHAVLRDVPLDGDRASVEDLARLGARVVGAPEVEREAAVAGVLACLAHPVMRRAAAAKRCHRELPVMVRGEQGELIEGVIDLAFEEEDGWVVVDFKVTADLKQQQVLYENQLSWYVRALAEGTGKVVEAWLLGV